MKNLRVNWFSSSFAESKSRDNSESAYLTRSAAQQRHPCLHISSWKHFAYKHELSQHATQILLRYDPAVQLQILKEACLRGKVLVRGSCAFCMNIIAHLIVFCAISHNLEEHHSLWCCFAGSSWFPMISIFSYELLRWTDWGDKWSHQEYRKHQI